MYEDKCKFPVQVMKTGMLSIALLIPNLSATELYR